MKSLAKITLFIYATTIFFYSGCAQHYFDSHGTDKKKLRILVIAPHPDDDIIGCGGTIARLINQGNQVTIVYMTSGDAYAFGAYFDLSHLEDRLAVSALREREARSAANILGTDDLIFLRYSDGYLTETSDSVLRLAEIIRIKKPDFIYCPHNLDQHKDHKITYKIVTAALDALWQQRAVNKGFGKIPTLLVYEVWTPLQDANILQEISSVMDKKISALQKHTSQINSVINIDLPVFNELFGVVLSIDPLNFFLDRNVGDLVVVQKYYDGYPVERFMQVDRKNGHFDEE
jgi:LmbE family N-acetylglucosaminyl deacetylase